MTVAELSVDESLCIASSVEQGTSNQWHDSLLPGIVYVQILFNSTDKMSRR